MEKIKISAVSYLNTIPFQFGMEQDALLKDQISLSRDIPSRCAEKLLSGDVDLGLVPVAVIPEIPGAEIVSDYCIGADGAVHTVNLYSEVPLEEIKSIYLDYQSRTSVALCQILCREHWKIEPKFLSAEAGYEEGIGGSTAGVVIGDRTFHFGKHLPFRYDLSLAWRELTGLPFVFAAWVANKPLPPAFLADFNRALKSGLEAMDEAIAAHGQSLISEAALKTYLSEHIDYPLQKEKKKALNLFLEKLKGI